MALNDLQHVPGAIAAPAETHGFVFNHTMLRVKDAKQSLDFYTRVLGFRLLDARDFCRRNIQPVFSRAAAGRHCHSR